MNNLKKLRVLIIAVTYHPDKGSEAGNAILELRILRYYEFLGCHLFVSLSDWLHLFQVTLP